MSAALATLPARATLPPTNRSSSARTAGIPTAAGTDWHSRKTLHAGPKSRDLTRSNR